MKRIKTYRYKPTMTLITVIAIVGSAFLFSVPKTHAQDVTLYKNPQCGCCENYADYLRENGFTVSVKPTHNLSSMSRDAGIPENLQGCHLALIDDYVVSGHVPINTVNKLLKERPDIKGITLPGMPMGSPGMSGSKKGKFTIYSIGNSSSEVYATE